MQSPQKLTVSKFNHKQGKARQQKFHHVSGDPLVFWSQSTKDQDLLATVEKRFLLSFIVSRWKSIDLEDTKFAAIIKETERTMKLSLCKLLVGVH